MPRPQLVTPILCALCLPLGCNDPETGTLTVEYKLGNGDPDNCTNFDITAVRATLGEDEYAEESTCGEPVVLTGVPVGKWDLVVEAVASDGTVVMDNEATAERVEILGGAAVTAEPQLTATPARVFVRWSININGFQAQCNDATVQTRQFRVQAWDAISALLAEETFDCDAPTDPDVPSYRRVADEERRIAGNLLDSINVEALDGSGMGLIPVPVFNLDGTPPGPGRAVYLTVQCNDNMCMSTGNAPYDTK